MAIFGNKKGSLMDMALIIVILVFFSIVVLVGLKMGGAFNDQLQGMSDIPAEGKIATNQAITSYTHTIDNVFLFLTIGMCMVTLVLAALVRVHPIFIPFFFIGWVIVIFLAGIGSNMYQSMAADDMLKNTATTLTITGFIMGYLPIIIAVMSIILMVVMYKIWSVGE